MYIYIYICILRKPSRLSAAQTRSRSVRIGVWGKEGPGSSGLGAFLGGSWGASGLLMLHLFLIIFLMSLQIDLGAIWGPFWGQLGPQNPPKIDQKSIKQSMNFLITFLIDLLSICVPFWDPSWPQNRSKIDLDTQISKL